MQRAGLNGWNLILSVEGRLVQTEREPREALESDSPGDRIQLTVVHPDGDRRPLTAQLAETPAPQVGGPPLRSPRGPR